MVLRAPTLAQRMVAMVLGFVLLVWLFTVAVAWFVTQHELRELLDAHLAQTAALLSTGEVEHDVDNVQVRAPVLLHKHQSRVAFQIWRDGRLRARSADAPDLPMAPDATPGLSDQALGEKQWRVFTMVRLEGERHKETIYVGERESARHDVLLGGLRGTLIPLLLALPLLALAVVWSVRHALRPLRELSASVTARQPQALTALPDERIPPEVQPLVQALNGLFERMTDVLESERRFTADAAHELRTPIAAIRMQAQVARGATADAERQTALDATVAGCDWATRLVEQLLQLARLESERADSFQTTSPYAQADLAALVVQQAGDMQGHASERGQRIAMQGPAAGVVVPIHATLLTVLLRNLLDNALRYSPDGAHVALTVAAPAEGAGAVLTVEDSGPGLPDEALRRLGDRFFRVLGTRQTGSGLGWSIVRRLARTYQLELRVDRSPALGGLRVQVRWPASVDA